MLILFICSISREPISVRSILLGVKSNYPTWRRVVVVVILIPVVPPAIVSVSVTCPVTIGVFIPAVPRIVTLWIV